MNNANTASVEIRGMTGWRLIVTRNSGAIEEGREGGGGGGIGMWRACKGTELAEQHFLVEGI